MNKNIIIVLAGGLLIAVLVAVLVQSSLKSSKPRVVSEEVKEYILVAAKDLKLGAELKPGDLRWQAWPKSAIFPGAIKREADEKPEEIVSGRLNRTLLTDEPLLKSAIVSNNSNLSALLPKGMRAIAITVKAETMAGGFIGPGDYVDVLLTYETKISTDRDDKLAKNVADAIVSKYATETILENIKVLAVDQAAEREKPDAKIGKTVTLAVTLKDAEKLALSSEMGLLVLALRSLGDNEVSEMRWPVITDRRLTKILEEIYGEYIRKISTNDNGQEAQTVPLTNTSGVGSSIVRIYNGNSVQDVPVR